MEDIIEIIKRLKVLKADLRSLCDDTETIDWGDANAIDEAVDSLDNAQDHIEEAIASLESAGLEDS